MRLYFSPGACSLAPHIVLQEIGLEFDLERVDTSTHSTQNGGDFYAINPKGAVPVLEYEPGKYLTEGPIICQYIADKAGATDLMPASGTVARYRVQEWQNYVTSELHKSFSPLFNNPALDPGGKVAFQKALTRKLGWVNSQLEGKTFLTGEHFTVADAYLFVVAGWAKYVGIDLSPLTNLTRFLELVASRPAVKNALAAEEAKK